MLEWIFSSGKCAKNSTLYIVSSYCLKLCIYNLFVCAFTDAAAMDMALIITAIQSLERTVPVPIIRSHLLVRETIVGRYK